MYRLMIAAVALALTLAGAASAQPPGPWQRNQKSPLSPYLNLTLGRDPAVNYFNAVLPDQRQRNLQDRLSLQETLQRRQLTLDDVGDYLPTLPETGHVARFMNYGPYYN